MTTSVPWWLYGVMAALAVSNLALLRAIVRDDRRERAGAPARASARSAPRAAAAAGGLGLGAEQPGPGSPSRAGDGPVRAAPPERPTPSVGPPARPAAPASRVRRR